MGLVMVKNFPNRLLAEQAEQILKEEGITCLIKAPDYGAIGSGTGAGLGAWQGVYLYVQEEAAERANELMQAFFNGI